MIIFTIIILNSNCIKLYKFFFSNDVIFLKFYALAVSLFNKNSESSGGGISDVTSYPWCPCISPLPIYWLVKIPVYLEDFISLRKFFATTQENGIIMLLLY